ncbi:hypothetical protein AGLY_006266 [Aphis glycines]|uniref:Uncharacterized protein n=1 Tax=Aphis glycines TaxID=307491 RepID=A0A6G0TQR6_APHGL|nr:hypothetical protein AGLY_006266 [Aphis glycines]
MYIQEWGLTVIMITIHKSMYGLAIQNYVNSAIQKHGQSLGRSNSCSTKKYDRDRHFIQFTSGVVMCILENFQQSQDYKVSNNKIKLSYTHYIEYLDCFKIQLAGLNIMMVMYDFRFTPVVLFGVSLMQNTIKLYNDEQNKIPTKFYMGCNDVIEGPTYEIVDRGRPPRDRDITADSRDGQLVVDKA